MIPIKRIGKMRINNRKREEFCSLFECPVCCTRIIRPTGEGKRLTACSQRCSQLGKRRGPHKEFVVISGYKYIYAPDHPNATRNGYVGEHRLVLANKIGRYLKQNEVAHHINENKFDNRPENIELMTFEEHSSYHAKKRARGEKNEFIAISSVGKT